MLRRCLMSLVPAFRSAGWRDRIIVVENDDRPGSRKLLEELQVEFSSLKLSYVHEPQLGIPYARNAGLEFGLASGCEWLAFLDDDERVHSDWLESMRRAAIELGADALAGPVRSIPEVEPPDWLRPAPPAQRPHGQHLDMAATNNAMISTRWMIAHGQDLRFDTTLRFTGGSDTDFFARLVKSGGRLRWAGDAWVDEDIPAERLTLDWQLQRSARIAANAYLRDRKFEGSLNAAVSHFTKGLRKLAAGTALLAIGGLVVGLTADRGRRLIYRGQRSLASGSGAVRAVFGITPEPYKRVTGS